MVGIDFHQHLRVIELRIQRFLPTVSLTKEDKVQRLLGIWAAPAPDLRGSGVGSRLLVVQIVSIENQGLTGRVEDAAIRFRLTHLRLRMDRTAGVSVCTIS